VLSPRYIQQAGKAVCPWCCPLVCVVHLLVCVGGIQREDGRRAAGAPARPSAFLPFAGAERFRACPNTVNCLRPPRLRVRPARPWHLGMLVVDRRSTRRIDRTSVADRELRREEGSTDVRNNHHLAGEFLISCKESKNFARRVDSRGDPAVTPSPLATWSTMRQQPSASLVAGGKLSRT